MMFFKQVCLEGFAPNVGGRRGHVHHFTGSPNREHTPERNILCRWTQRNFPTIRFDEIHNGRWNQQDEECDWTELRCRVVDALGTNMPDEESEGEQADKKEDYLKHGTWRKA